MPPLPEMQSSNPKPPSSSSFSSITSFSRPLKYGRLPWLRVWASLPASPARDSTPAAVSSSSSLTLPHPPLLVSPLTSRQAAAGMAVVVSPRQRCQLRLHRLWRGRSFACLTSLNFMRRSLPQPHGLRRLTSPSTPQHPPPLPRIMEEEKKERRILSPLLLPQPPPLTSTPQLPILPILPLSSRMRLLSHRSHP